MSGRLILLPHKSWNVWNREAIAKVRNDEKAHQEEIELANEKKLKIESEARLEILRKRASCSTTSHSNDVHENNDKLIGHPHKVNHETLLEGEHINLFAEYEHSLGTNIEHEEEKKRNERAELKKGGVNNLAPLALGGTQEERDKAAPWWGKFARAGMPMTTKRKPIYWNDSNEETEIDPKNSFKKTSKREKKTRKEKKKKQNKKDQKEQTSSSSISELRTKRLERETLEHARANDVITAHNPQQAITSHQSTKKYHSQFYS